MEGHELWQDKGSDAGEREKLVCNERKEEEKD